jgi:tetratricopeptide (TPR) repeat protein
LKLEPDSVQILRDLAFCQAQMRDFAGYTHSRRLMLQAKPILRQNWTALAVAQHLDGELRLAEETLKTYEGTLKTAPPGTDLEHSEAQIYQNMIIEESGDIERALEHLESISKTNLDRQAIMEARARFLLKLNRLEEAEEAYQVLLDRNNEYRFYYECLERTRGLDRSKKEDIPKLIELYNSYIQGNERVDAPRRIPLDFLQGMRNYYFSLSFYTKIHTRG